MRRLSLLGILVALVAIGAAQGARVRHLRESEAFYRWILAAAVNERLFQDESGQYKDKELFDACNASVSGALAGIVSKAAPAESGETQNKTVSALGQASEKYENDEHIWNLARGSEMAKQRAEFLALLKTRQLRFAQDIAYAEAQESGVGLFNLFFGFRKVAANFLWIQVDRYWHQGNMHRMVAMMKTCTTLDPHFVEAYMIGAWHLSYNATAKMPDTPWVQREWDPKLAACVGEKERYYYQAISFLKDGIRNNPRNYKLYFDLGFAIYKQKLKDYSNAVKYLSEAIRQPHDRWVPRQLFQCQELNGQYDEALAGWQDYVKRFPGTPTTQEVAPRFIHRNEAKILEKKAAKYFKDAEAATDPAEAERLRKEGKPLRDQARQIWAKVGDTEGDAYGMRLDAVELRGQKRYMEAIAILDKARWECSELWDELSDMIIECKKEGNLPLSMSEQKYLERTKNAGVCQGMPEEERARVLQKAAKQQ